MTHAQLLLAVILIQQGLFGGLWLIAARLRMARRAALHWAAALWLVAAGMGLILVRDPAAPWLTLALPNLLLVLALAILRRGIQVFTRRPRTDREHALIVLGVALLLAVVVGVRPGVLPVGTISSGAIGLILLRAALDVRDGLSAELGRRAARWCALPAAAIGALYTGRAALLLLQGSAAETSIAGAGLQPLVVTLGTLVFGLVINTMLLAMTILRLVQRLRHQSEHDVLTELLNRRAMERLLEAEDRRQRRSGEGYAILSLDIDHFKRINDRHGHAAGDRVLVRVAQVLQGACRGADRVARMGGEEFAVLLPGTDEAGAMQAAERLVEAVRTLALDEVEPGLRVTVSVGLVFVGAQAEPLPALLRRLDQALYAAKRLGRDRIERGDAATRPA